MPAPEYPYLPDQVDIYISYTQREARDKEVAQALYNACEAHPCLRPYIDACDIPYQANIYEYMDTLSSAPFVVCIFSEEYFQSENCVLEFVGICHSGFLERRLVPLFAAFFFNDADRKKWMLFKADDELLRERVKDKSDKDLKDLLEYGRKEVMERLAGVNEKDAEWHKEDNFKTFITTFLETANNYNKEQFEHFRKELIRKVESRLASSSFEQFIQFLASKLNCSANSSSCSTKLFEKDPLGSMEKLVDSRNACTFNEVMEAYFQEIFGYFLIYAINPGWWIMNEFRLKHSIENGYGLEAAGLTDKYEIEIVFARLGKRPAMYRANNASIEPEHFIRSNPSIPFSQETQYVLESYLRTFYEDITHTSLEGEMITDNNDLMKTLKGRFSNLKRRGRHYFYIIPKDEYEKMKEIGVFHEINSVSNKAVQFVVVGKGDGVSGVPPVLTVNSDDILGYLSEIHHG